MEIRAGAGTAFPFNKLLGRNSFTEAGVVAVSSTVDPAAVPTKTARKPYVPAVGPRLRIVLWIVFALTALLGANSAYRLAISTLGAVGPAAA